MVSSYTQTAVYDQPVIAFPSISGVVIDGSSPGGTTIIPLVLTGYVPAMEKANTTQIGTGPITQDNFAFGGTAISESGVELPKAKLEGFIDTPTTPDGVFQVPNIVLDTFRYTYAELIAIYFEGRAGATWGLINPSYFRDPYGRQYNRLQILEFSAGYVEAVPGRTTFQMTLRV